MVFHKDHSLKKEKKKSLIVNCMMIQTSTITSPTFSHPFALILSSITGNLLTKLSGFSKQILLK
jgi:hypothetical protein